MTVGADLKSLTIKGMPERLLETLCRLAADHHRSLNQEVMECIRLGVLHQPSPEKHRESLRKLDQHIARQKRLGMSFDDVDVVALIRRGREAGDGGR